MGLLIVCEEVGNYIYTIAQIRVCFFNFQLIGQYILIQFVIDCSSSGTFRKYLESYLFSLPFLEQETAPY